MNDNNVAGAPDEDALDQSRRTAKRGHRQRKLSTLFALLAIGLTLYFTALNGYLLWRAARDGLPPYRISYVSNLDRAQEYGISIDWDALDGVRPADRPHVWIDGRELAAPSQIRVQPTGPDRGAFDVRLVLDGATVAGTHAGWIRVRTPAGVIAREWPVAVRVNSMWADWWLLRDWLAVVLVLYVLFGAICWYLFPRPSGSLEVWRSGDPDPQIHVLRAPGRAWLRPWARGTVPLRRIWRNLGETPAGSAAGGCLRFYSFTPWPLLETDRGEFEYVDGRFHASRTPVGGGPVLGLNSDLWVVFREDPSSPTRPGTAIRWTVRFRYQAD